MCVKNRACAVLFGCALMPAWLLILVLGVMVGIFSNSKKSTIESFCDNMDMQSEYIAKIRTFVSNVDDMIGDLVSDKMCSEICPCPNNQNKFNWMDIEEAVLNTYGRTKEPNPDNPDLVPLFFSDLVDKRYEKFSECFKDIRVEKTSDSQAEVDKYNELINNGSLSFAVDF